MYAKNLSLLLHRELSEEHSYQETLKRFESLRGYGQLPRGRGKAGQRLTNEEISRAILGFVPTRAGWAGHAALIMSELRPVGGQEASFRKAASLVDSMAAIFADDEICDSLFSLSLSIARISGNDAYHAKLRFEQSGQRRVVSFVSKNALSLSAAGAEINFDHDRPLSTNTRQLILNREFFRELKYNVDLSRHWNRPLDTDWREYKTEEERSAFHKRLGAQKGSNFLNLGVEASVTWPKDPTRIRFGGHYFVLFPKTKENSQSISIDLARERITSEDARTLLNRFLSVSAWCDDRHAILRNGWSGGPVPSPVPRRDLSSSTMMRWMFHRSMPGNDQLLKCLAYYRDGLNGGEAGIVSHEIVSFFKVFEIGFKDEALRQIGSKVRAWIEVVFDEACKDVDRDTLDRFHQANNGKDLGRFVYENFRVAAAHASKRFPSDADMSTETRRLRDGAKIMQALARYYIRTTFHFSASYLSD